MLYPLNFFVLWSSCYAKLPHNSLSAHTEGTSEATKGTILESMQHRKYCIINSSATTLMLQHELSSEA